MFVLCSTHVAWHDKCRASFRCLFVERCVLLRHHIRISLTLALPDGFLLCVVVSELNIEIEYQLCDRAGRRQHLNIANCHTTHVEH